MQDVCAEARERGKTVTIAVEKYNPAQRLYRRLGFYETSDEGIYWFMEWRAAPDGARPASGNSTSRSNAIRAASPNASPGPSDAAASCRDDCGLNNGWTKSSGRPSPKRESSSTPMV